MPFVDESPLATHSEAASPVNFWIEPKKTNTWLTERTKMHIYQARVLSTLLYGSETWCTYMRQEHHLNSFHLQCLKLILGVKWQDYVTNSEKQSRAGTPAYTPYSVSAAWDDWGMFKTWMVDASPKKFYNVNWREKSGNSGAPLCGLKTHAKMTLKYAKFIQTTGKMLCVNVPPGEGQWKKESKKPTWNVTGKLKRSAIAAKTLPLCPPLASSASCAVGTATRLLGTLQHHHGLLRAHKLYFSRLAPPFIWPLVTNSYSLRLSLTTMTIMIMTNGDERSKIGKNNKHKRTNTKY